MSLSINPEAFARFVTSRRKDLQRISRATQGEASVGDVENEAYVMIAVLASKGTAIDLNEPSHQKLLLSHLYQELVRYTELTVRYSVRLDHSLNGEPDEPHPLASALAADESFDPAVAIRAAQEAAATTERDPLPHESLAGAYVHLLRRFDNRMRDVADHLLISLSYCYKRWQCARELAIHQRPLPARRQGDAFVPAPWRSFRIARKPLQLSLDFGNDAALFEANAP